MTKIGRWKIRTMKSWETLSLDLEEEPADLAEEPEELLFAEVYDKEINPTLLQP
jgi:hypothetical protein